MLRLLCKIGWHRWEFRDVIDQSYDTTYARCRNPECRFHFWSPVNVEKVRKPW